MEKNYKITNDFYLHRLPQLVRVLRELRYVWVLGEDLSEGTELASRRETFRKYTANLQLVTDW